MISRGSSRNQQQQQQQRQQQQQQQRRQQQQQQRQNSRWPATAPDAQGDGVGALVQAAVVELQAGVVQVDCRHSRAQRAQQQGQGQQQVRTPQRCVCAPAKAPRKPNPMPRAPYCPPAQAGCLSLPSPPLHTPNPPPLHAPTPTRVDELRVPRKVLAPAAPAVPELVHRQVLQDVMLDCGDIAHADPVLGGGAHKALRAAVGAAGVAAGLARSRGVAAQVGVDGGEDDQQVRVVALQGGGPGRGGEGKKQGAGSRMKGAG